MKSNEINRIIKKILKKLDKSDVNHLLRLGNDCEGHWGWRYCWNASFCCFRLAIYSSKIEVMEAFHCSRYRFVIKLFEKFLNYTEIF